MNLRCFVLLLTLVILKSAMGVVINENQLLKVGPAVYSGVVRYGDVTMDHLEEFSYGFYIDGRYVTYGLQSNPDFVLQNLLKEGAVYNLQMDSGVVVSLESCPVVAKGRLREVDVLYYGAGDRVWLKTEMVYGGEVIREIGGAKLFAGAAQVGSTVEVYAGPDGYYVLRVPEESVFVPKVQGVAGRRTLANFLKMAMEPVGGALYVYGGGWNWQDSACDEACRSIGISTDWFAFFRDHAQNYCYRNDAYPSGSTYPYGRFNEYHYAGLDCSAFVGWVVYNTLHDESGKRGYVCPSARQAQWLAQLGLGTFQHEGVEVNSLRVGDVFSMKGHVWICLGVCSDGSVLLVHSTASEGRAGQVGGGVQLSALGDSEACEAYKLACAYMERYYAEWSQWFVAVMKSPEFYLSLGDVACTGLFSWYRDERGLADSEGLTSMSVCEVLGFLFDE